MKKITPKQAGKAAQMESARQRMIGQFPEASQSDIIKANNPKERRKGVAYEHFRYHGDGVVQRVDAPPSDGFFKSSTLRHKHMTPKLRKVKYKIALWNQQALVNYFREHNINASDEKNRWHLYTNTPNQKIGPAEQLTIFLAHSDTIYKVFLNEDHKHLILDELNP